MINETFTDLLESASFFSLLTILGTGSKEIDDIFMLPNHLHHLHL